MRCNTTFSTSSRTGPKTIHPIAIIQMWARLKRRMNKDRGKLVRQKAMGGAELVAAGTALTGGSILMEKMMDSDPKPQLSGHNNVYALDSSPSFFKVESLAGKDELSTIKIVGWVIFGLILLLLIVPVIRAIIIIMKICKQRT